MSLRGLRVREREEREVYTPSRESMQEFSIEDLEQRFDNRKPRLWTRAWLGLTAVCCSGADPKTYNARYNVTGTGGVVSLTYTNQDGGTEQQEVGLPGSKSFSVRNGSFLYISAQRKGSIGTITTNISIDGVTRKSATSEGEFVIASSDYSCCY